MGCLLLKAEAADLSSRAAMVSVSSRRLNVRSGPSSGSAVVHSLPKGSYVTLISQSGSWWKVEYGKNQFGYCHGDYLSTPFGKGLSVQTNGGNLNVRSGAGTGYGKVASLAKGETVILLEESGTWSRIVYHGSQTGYVSSQYLSDAYSPVSLWVRDMKQMDERWADTLVGTSGKTMAQIGCATTAIAMLEAHRTGITVYPDVMTTRLKYTPSGSVYWPEHYTVVSLTDGYLSRLYNLLRQGKPVLLGATNRYGSQHWVIVTGYGGGNTLSASGFSIRDPGTYARTNLQQFLDAYPNVYKFFYY